MPQLSKIGDMSYQPSLEFEIKFLIMSNHVWSSVSWNIAKFDCPEVCGASLPGKTAGQACRTSLPGKPAGQACRASLPGKPARHVGRASLPGKSAGQVCRASLPGKSAGQVCRQVCRSSLPGKSAGQVCRASLPGKSAGQVCRAICRASLPGKSAGQVWICLSYLKLATCLTSQVLNLKSSFWSCLIMFDQVSAEILLSLIKGVTNNNNNKSKCIPGGSLRVLAGKNL
jgi:hypothetical protein